MDVGQLDNIDLNNNLRYYNLAKDRVRRDTKPLECDGYSDVVAFALNVSKQMDVNKPKLVHETLT